MADENAEWRRGFVRELEEAEENDVNQIAADGEQEGAERIHPLGRIDAGLGGAQEIQLYDWEAQARIRREMAARGLRFGNFRRFGAVNGEERGRIPPAPLVPLGAGHFVMPAAEIERRRQFWEEVEVRVAERQGEELDRQGWMEDEEEERPRRRAAVTEEMITEAKTLREKDENTPSTARFSRACLVCAIENPHVRAVFINCGHIVCYPCAVDNARSDATNGKCVFCREKSDFVKLFEEEDGGEKKKNDDNGDN